MKKHLIIGLFAVIFYSCNKDNSTINNDDCLLADQYMIYDNHVAMIYQNAKISTRTFPDGKTITGKWVELTPEVSKIIELRDQAYIAYVNDQNTKKSPIIMTAPTGQWRCWQCICPNGDWAGNLYECMQIWGNPCGGWQCPLCGHLLNTWAIPCSGQGGYCND